MALYDTVANIVSDAAVELGLGSVSDVFASTDANVIQLRTLLKRVGRRLTLERRWTQLQVEHTFSTVSGTAAYNLPADFSMMIDQTGWNRTSDHPAHPLNPQQWQYLKASASTAAFTVMFRPRELTIEIYPTPSAVETIAFEYVSRYWVRNTGGTTLDKDAPTINTDVLMFDAVLLVPALKLAWLSAKGFDTTAALEDYNHALRLVESANVVAAPALSLNGAGGVGLLTPLNAPETGFGA